ncbi:mitochondrial dynamics protein MID49 [Conger conger]|uniref:mitochondrial dynamics protein MID49 n=1 Tax=Conger conger TaxID=82655 RepID=UPI002A5A1D56|nr:mitochondrial dynamics protein MID49 [Conger conger]XP_061088056.1 mitochondrial dynamics protein MID49 [Conger conger]XP_061088057.1 mitochondrial dynamics protein MID49 [Conger conger]XP_061088058.1 mitochondrial dynamics protein MID49 [Conger conger]XP_061088059.1 mitochondrial dynamics protein MID49 [Conger conger]
MDSRGKRRGEDGLAAVIDFLLANARLVLGVGGAAILGIATLAVKRLIERAGRAPDDEKPDQKTVDGWEELSLVSSSPKLLRKGIEGVVMKQIAAATKTQKAELSKPSSATAEKPKVEVKRLQLCVSPQERLKQYYESHVALSADEVSRAQQQALDICTEIQGFLHSKHPDMPLGEMHLGGSLLDDLQVVSADHACLLVPLQIEDVLWKLIPGEETILGRPEFWMVRRINLEYFPRGRSFWDRFMVGGYLSSKTIVEVLNKSVMETMNWPSLSSTLDCVIRPVMGSQELKLEIKNGHSQLFISILPTIRLNETVLTAQMEFTGNFDNVWYHSLYTAETTKLAQLDEEDHGIRKLCLKILKAVCKNCPSLKKLTGAHLANVILHLSEKEYDWTEAALADRFQQAITEMIGYLEIGCLPSYFKQTINLLSDFTEEEIDEIGFMLYCAVSDPEILLQM